MVRSPSAGSKTPSAAFQSHPTDLELVNSYLRPRVEGSLKAGSFIHEADVYAADPANLTRQFAPAVAQDGERAWYFFTPLRHKSVRGKRKARTVATGEGCWHNEAKSKPVYTGINGKRQIGHRQSFSFVKKDGSVRVRTGWLMMELRVLKEGAAQGEQEGAMGNLVLCKVYRSPRNPEPSGRDAALKEEAAESDDESSGATAEDDDDDDNNSDAPLATELEAPARKEKAADDEESAETSAAAPTRKRKAPDGESSGPAASAAKRKADGSSSPGAPTRPTTEMQMECPHCGHHLVVTLTKPEPKPEAEIAKDGPAPGASDAPQRGETRGFPEKNLQFHQFL